MTESVAQRDPVEQLAEDFLARLRRGERPTVGEYAAAHPDLADEIRDLFPALVLMEEAKPAGTESAAPAVGPDVFAGRPPEHLGDYRILREVARGGMGVVYEAEQVSLGRHVALKILPAQGGGDPVRLLRFRREARSAARLHHTNIVPVFEVGSAGGVHYYAMQFIQGQGLDEVLQELRRLRDGRPTDAADDALTATLAEGLRTGEFAAAPIVPKPRSSEPRSEPSSILTGPVSHYFRSVAGLGVQAADALAYAHGQRVLHRDVKPSNLLLDRQGTLWLTDFGLAKDDTEDLTRTGDGTLRYMAPERFHGVSDPRTDVYALGVTLYELLTLRPAFPEGDRVLLLRQIAQEEPPRPRAVDPTIPRDLETIVLKAIEKDPARRYPTAAALADDLRCFLADRPIKARRATWREQAWRCCRRNPGVAASLSLVFLLLTLLVVGLAVGTAVVWDALRKEKQAAYDQLIALAGADLAANRVARGEDHLARCDRGLRRWEWHYLNRSRGRPARALQHPHPVTGKSALCRDGRWLATAGRNGVVTVWDLAAEPPNARHIAAHATGCWNVAFSPDGVLVSVNEEPERDGGQGEVRFWDPATGEKARPGWDLGDRFVNALAFSPDGQRLAVTHWLPGHEETQVEIRDAATGRVTLAVTPHGRSAQGLVFSPDGKLLASSGNDQVVRVHEAATGRVVHTFRDGRPGKHLYWAVAFSPDGRRLAAGYGDENEIEPGGVRLWEVGTWREAGSVTGHDVFALAWGPAGRLATGGSDGTVRVWDADRGIELLTLRGHIDVVGTLAYTPDGHRLVSVSQDRIVRVWDATPVRDGEVLGDELATLTGHRNAVTAIAFHPTEPVLLSAGADGQALAWDARDWSARPRLLLSEGEALYALAIAPDGRWFAYGGESAPRGAIRGTRDGTDRVALQVEGDFWPFRLGVAPDGRSLAGCDINGQVVVFDVATGTGRRLVRLPPWSYGVAFGPDASRPLLAVVSTGAGVRVYDPTTGGEVARLEHAGSTAEAFNPGGTRLASVGWDNVVRVWRTDTWALDTQYRDPGGGPNRVAFSPDGTLLAWGGVDGTVKVWKVGTDAAETLRGHRNWVWDVAFSPDGAVLASAGRDGTVKVWKNPYPKK